MSSQKPLLLLALNSPLYAPAVLAVAKGKKTKSSTHSFAGRFEIALAMDDPVDENANPKAAYTETLIPRILDRSLSRNRLVIGVCDPMRVCSVAKAYDFEEPTVLGALIDRMCYWLYDGKKSIPADNWFDSFRTILVHPQGYTGYTVAAYDILTARNLDPRRQRKKALAALSRKLRTFKNPDREQEEYHAHTRGRGSSDGPSGSVAYISTVPLHSIHDAPPDSRPLRLHAFGVKPTDISASETQRDFSKAVMTALLTSSQHEDTPMVGQHLSEFVASTGEAIEDIRRDPDMAAYEICAYIYKSHNWSIRDPARRFLGVGRARHLAACLQFLNEEMVFNERSDLRVEQTYIDNTLKIRNKVHTLLDREHQYRDPDSLKAALSRCAAS